LEADAPRVACPEHGVVVAAVPWARPGARSTRVFEDTCAWLAGHAAFTVVAALLRVSWRTVAGVVTRVVADLAGRTDQLAGLRRIGIDEIAHRYAGDLCQGLRRGFLDEFFWCCLGRS
jgi:transposase